MKNKILSTTVFLLVLVLSVTLFSCGGALDDSYFYIQGGELYYRTGLKEGRKITSLLAGNTEDGALPETLASRVCFGGDKKYIYFTDNADSSADAVTYYVTDLTDKNENRLKIDTRISRIVPDKKGNKVIYLKDGELYSYVFGGTPELIAGEVADFAVSEGHKAIAYVTSDNSVLYVKAGSKAPSQLDTAISSLGHVDGKGNVYYTKNRVLYKTKAVKNKEPSKTKLFTTGLDDVFVGGTCGKGFYFLSASESPLDVSAYVTDSEFENDSKITTVLDRPKEPSRSGFSSDEEYGKAYSLYEKDLDAYYKSYNAFNLKTARDEIRAAISSAKEKLTIFNLCRFDGKNVKTVAENVDISNLFISETSAMGAALVCNQPADAETCCDISEFDSYGALSEKVKTFISEKSVKSAVTFVSAKAKNVKGDSADSILCFGMDDKSVFVIFTDGSLSKINVKTARASVVTEKYEGSGVLDANGGKTIFYSEISGSSSKLFLGKKQLGENVLPGSALMENGVIYFMVDWSPEAKAGTLMCCSNGKTTLISYDVTSFALTDAGNCVFVKDSVLYVHYGRIKQLGEKVSMVLANIS